VDDPRHSDRWRQWRAAIDIEEYEARFQAMAASGHHAHGEADFLHALEITPILDAGCGTGRVAIELARRGVEVVGVDLDDEMLAVARRNAPHLQWICDDLATMQLGRRFPLVAMPGNVMIFVRPDDRRLVVHNLAAHLEPGGVLVAGFSLEPGGLGLDEYDELCQRCGLELVDRVGTWDRQRFDPAGGYHVSIHARTSRSTVHDLVADARRDLDRLHPQELAAELAAGAATVLDTRTPTDRERFGTIAGAVHLTRTTLEWRCDPASGYSHPAITGLDQRLVVVCNDGYSSSIAAASLRGLGFARATDLVGGMHGWIRAGLPVVPPDHTQW
jgi:rhodanese-related sulfurtransferase